MDTSNETWWYELNGQQIGPIKQEQILELYNQRVITSESLIWQEGTPRWIKMKESLLNSQAQTSYISTEITSSVLPNKWYNDKFKLALSILLWPLLIYGIYKTALINKKTKQIIAGVFVLLIIVGSFGKGNGSMSSGSVRQSPFDNSVDCVEYYLKHKYLKDPDSYQGIEWSKVINNQDGTYNVTHTFRARNGYGGMGIETLTFTIASDGWTVLNAY